MTAVATIDAGERRVVPHIGGHYPIMFLIALALYLLTADRGPQWQDSGWQQLRIVSGEINHPLGLALTHPLHFYLGRFVLLLPIPEPALAITLISVIAGALAVANLAATIHLLTDDRRAASATAFAFMMSHTFWQHSTHTESYALVGALLTFEWLCIARFALTPHPIYLVLLAATNGLGLSNHMLAALATPIDAIIIIWAVLRRGMPWWVAPTSLVAWAVCTLPYTTLVWQRFAETGNFAETIRSATVGDFREQVLNTSLSLRSLAMSAGFVFYNLPNLILPLAAHALFWRVERRRPLYWAIPALLAIYVAFVMRYSIADQYTFFFPVYALLALLAGIALGQMLRHWTELARTILLSAVLITSTWSPLLYATAAEVTRANGFLKGTLGNKPYRDGYRDLFMPWGDRGYVRRTSEEAYTLAGSDGMIVIDDLMTQFAMKYEQAIRRHPATVQLVVYEYLRLEGIERSTIREALQSGRTVVLVPRDRDNPAPQLTGALWQRQGDLYVLLRLEDE
ncbi:MAG: protein O-mannosyl-transferase family [Phycisphaerae bacterium]